MLTTKLHEDGELYHAQYVWDTENIRYDTRLGDDNLEFILDEDGDMIPAYVCLCYAREPSECCCGCTSWDDENYEDYENYEDDFYD